MREPITNFSDPIYLEAAYGRSYATAEVAICAWNEGKDFKIRYGPYCSIRDIKGLKRLSEEIYIVHNKGKTQI